ncbi:MAG TPA: hypothetical protein VKS21_00145, partial [Spirochaetota bacterium]|nr:hypothetical protein [Spirochaetota bacterium]
MVRKKIFLLSIILTLLVFGIAQEQNSLYDEFIKPGAESKAYGRALTAYNGNIIALFYNPANIAFLTEDIELYMAVQNSRYIKDIKNITLVAGSGLLRRHSLYTAVGWRQLNYNNAFDHQDNENIISLGSAYSFKKFAIGLTPKLFISRINSSQLKTTGKGFGLDIGLSFRYKKLLLGLSALNIISLIKFDTSNEQSTKPVLNMGASYQIGERG